MNSNGEKTAVIIPIKEFERRLADIGLTLEEYEREPFRPLRTMLDSLRAAGEIEI